MLIQYQYLNRHRPEKHVKFLGKILKLAFLIEAINLICDEYYERDMEFTVDNIVKKAKPHKAIKKYIDERYFAGLQDLILENNF